MKIPSLATMITIVAILAGGVAAVAPSGEAQAYSSMPSARSEEGFAVRSSDGVTRSITPDAVNTTSVAGMSATVSIHGTDQIVLSADGRVFMLKDADGGVLLSSSNPTLERDSKTVPARFVLEGDHLVVTPVDHTPNRERAACASSFWGNLIFNIGMAGVCAMLGIATGPGGVACTMALIGANLGIDWDKPC